MNRRTALQHVIVLGAGASLLASCQDKATITTKNFPLTGSQEKLLSALTETIIPSTDFVGAKELQSHKFILVMADDCASPDDQQKFMDGMKQFDQLCKQKHGSVFAKCSAQDREAFLKSIEEAVDMPELVPLFYRSMKSFTIQSFTSSEEYLTKVRNFSLIPPKFQGCVPVQAA